MSSLLDFFQHPVYLVWAVGMAIGFGVNSWAKAAHRQNLRDQEAERPISKRSSEHGTGISHA